VTFAANDISLKLEGKLTAFGEHDVGESLMNYEGNCQSKN
jgi:hypothetical protein